MIDTKHLVKSAEDFARSIGGYLDTQLDYIDNLRKRPKFFFGTTHVEKRVKVIKFPVPIIEIEDKEKFACLPRMRRKEKVPAKVPAKVLEREAEAVAEQPIKQPVKVPVQVGAPAKPAQKPVALPEPAAVPAPKPATPLIPKPKPVPAPKPPVPAGNKIVPSPRVTPAPANNIRPLSRPLVKPKTPAAAVQQFRSGLPVGTRGGIAMIIGGAVLSEVAMRDAERQITELIELRESDKTEYDRRVKKLRELAQTEKYLNPIFEITGAPDIPKYNILEAIGEAKPGDKPWSILGAFAPPVKNAYGARHTDPTYVLTGEKARELIFPQNKMGEVANAMYREVGSIMVGTSYSMALSLPRDSATYSEIGKLKSKFGMDRSFDPAIPGFPEQMGVFDSVAPEMPTAESGGFFGMLASGAKTIASAISRAVIPAAQASPPSPDDPVIIPNTDPSVAGMGVRPKGITNSKNVSGYPVTSAMGMRWHPILGDWRMHGGYDISVPQGKLVAINKPGEIVRAGNYNNGYGNMIDAWVPSINLQFRFAHLSSIVKTSGTFRAGEALGRIGSTGLSTGPHLHFETDTRKGGMTYGGNMNKQQTGNATKHLIIGDAVNPTQTAQGPDDPNFIGPRLPGQGGWGLRPDGTHGNSNVGDTNRGHDGTLYKLVPKPGYGYNMWVPVKKAQIFDDNLVAQERSSDLSVTRVNSIVPIPIQGPPQYTTKVVPIMKKRRTKPTFVISPLSKGVEYV